VTESRLKAMGVQPIGQLASMPVEAMEREFGKSGIRLWELAHGKDDSPVSPVRERKSLSQEHTFDTDVLNVEPLRRVVREQAEKVAERARSRSLRAKTVILKVRYADFRLVTRSKTLPRPVDNAAEVYAEATSLFGKAEIGRRPVRLVGVGLANFVREESKQLTFFEQELPW
jgi:DNA polymerase-4